MFRGAHDYLSVMSWAWLPPQHPSTDILSLPLSFTHNVSNQLVGIAVKTPPLSPSFAMWFVFGFLVLYLAVAIPKARVNGVSSPKVVFAIPARGCSTGPPSAALRQSHIELAREEKLLPRKTIASQTIMVDTVFNIVSTTDQAKAVTSGMVTTQVC